MSNDNREKAAQAIQLFTFSTGIPSYKAVDKQEDYLDTLILQSNTYARFKTNAYSSSAEYLAAATRRMKDDATNFANMLTHMTSKYFGNTVGLYEARKGYMTQLPIKEIMSIYKEMKPLDVVLEKTPFRLTDKFIPGHYGHVAVWVGTDEELTALGIWDLMAQDPDLKSKVAAYRKKIRDGHHIVEALRPGVDMYSLEHFLNIDDYLVLRHSNLSREQTQQYILNAFRQVGKDYDFNFDVESDRTIVCSELAYVVFKDEEWPTSKQLGRHTISPDHVANKATSRNPFYPVMLYYDGVKLNGDERMLTDALKLLLKEDYAGFQWRFPNFLGKSKQRRPASLEML